MKNKVVKGLLLSCAMLLAISCNTKKTGTEAAAVDVEQIKKEIQAKEDEFAATYNAGEMKTIGYYAEDAITFSQNAAPHVGREAIGEVYSEQRPYIISRAGFAGIQRYAQTWAGDNLTDWRTPKFNINTIMGMGLSGVANNGCDIGGFAGRAPEAE